MRIKRLQTSQNASFTPKAHGDFRYAEQERLGPEFEELAFEFEDVAVLLLARGRELFACFEFDPLYLLIRVRGFGCKKAVDFTA